MGQASKVEQAISRFESALYKLEASMVKIHDRESQLAAKSGQAEALQIEHNKLGKELDAVRKKAEQLVAVNQQAARRVENAITRIRKVLD